MTPPLPALRDFSDRLSPMVVKEMRQGLRTRFFTAALILFHVVMGCLMAAFLLDMNHQAAHETFWVVVIVTLLAVMPAQAFNALNAESREGTLDMLRLTSTSSFRIVWGKWFCLFSQSLLIAGSLLPYLIARYFISGSEIVPEVLGLLLLVISSGVFSAGVVAFSSQSSLWVRLLSNAALAFAAWMVGMSVFFLCDATEGQRMMTGLVNLRLWQQGLLLLGLPLLCGYGVYLFITLGASRIANAAEEHGSMKRIIALSVMSTLFVSGVFLALEYGIEGGLWCLLPMFIISVIYGMDVTTEDMPLYPCVIQAVAGRLSFLPLSVRYLFYPGWVSGVISYTILAVETLLLCIVMTASSSSHDGEMCPVFVCLLATVIVPLCLHGEQENRFARWWVVQALSVLATILVGAAGAATKGGLSVLGLFTPLTSLNASMMGTGILWIAGGFSLIWMLAAVVRSVSEIPRYEALEAECAYLSSRDATTHA